MGALTEPQPVHEYETVRLYADGGATTIELARPETLNAWNNQFGLDLLDAVQRVGADDSVRAVVIRGEGRAFSSGADLKDMSGRQDRSGDGAPDVRTTLTERYHPIITGVRTMPKPVIAAVRGPAVGIGLSLALSCDLVVASDTAFFMLAFVNIGLVPDGGSSLLVPARVGFTRAIEMALLGERVDAERALQWGLINAVYADADFDDAVAALAERLAKGPTRSYAGSKRQLNNWLYARMDEQLELEADIQQEMAGSSDFIEGVTAFVQKRPASFGGA